jgi:hypothetical protein
MLGTASPTEAAYTPAFMRWNLGEPTMSWVVTALEDTLVAVVAYNGTGTPQDTVQWLTLLYMESLLYKSLCIPSFPPTIYGWVTLGGDCYLQKKATGHETIIVSN